MIKKLKAPNLKSKIYPHKVIYFCDPMFCLGIKTEQEEYKRLVIPALENAGIKFKNVECTCGSDCIDKMCDIFFFDWGGMSIGNSLLQSFSKYIYKAAENRPNTLYVITSAFAKEAMKDAITDFGNDKPENIFLDIDSFCKYFKKHNKGL